MWNRGTEKQLCCSMGMKVVSLLKILLIRMKFDSTVVLRTKKDLFLADKGNKQKFINMLGDHLEQNGCTAHHAAGNADV